MQAYDCIILGCCMGQTVCSSHVWLAFSIHMELNSRKCLLLSSMCIENASQLFSGAKWFIVIGVLVLHIERSWFKPCYRAYISKPTYIRIIQIILAFVIDNGFCRVSGLSVGRGVALRIGTTPC